MNNLDIIKELLNNKVITKDEYITLANRLIPAKQVEDYTWGDIVEGYVGWCSEKYSKTTMRGYKICISKFITYITKMDDYNEASNEKFKPYTFQAVNKFISWMYDDNLGDQAISKVKYSLMALNSYLESIGIQTPDITSIKTPVKVHSTKNLTVLRVEEIFDVAACGETRARIVIKLCYEAGLKRVELSKVRVQDFNFEKRQLFVYQDNGDIDRVCILTQGTIDLIKGYIEDLYNDIERWNKSRQSKGLEIREDFGYLFQSVKTTVPSYPLLQTLLKKTATTYYSKHYDGDELKSKVSNFTFETIRNSRRVYLMAHGRSVKETMVIVGDRNYMSTYKLQKLVPVLYPELVE